jgi:tripartite ATP-independent transporter DctM subunit
MEIFLLFAVFLALLFVGVPVAVSMLFASIVNILYVGVPHFLAPERMVNSINSFPMLAVPFFIFAGVIMNRGGLTTRLVDVSRAFVGHFHGGTAQVNVLASILFSGISGSASADAAAIGSMLIPAMKKEGYDPGFAVGVTAASACIGPIIPPSIVMVIYGSMTEMSIAALFLAGILPGLAIGIGQMVIVAVISRRRKYPYQARIPWKNRFRVVYHAIPALIAPLIILGGIISGLYTPTEAGVVACVYGLFTGLYIYRELTWKDVRAVLEEAVEITAVPIFILASASIFGWLLTFHGFGDLLVDFLKSLNPSATVLLFLIVGMLFVIGLIVEGLAALIIFVPVLMPLIPAFGLNEIHLGLIIMITILIGTTTPPVGLQLYIASAIGGTSLGEVTIWPFVFIMLLIVVLIVLFPQFVTFIPTALGFA